jgi:outer membrane lipoprotein-sorting protein
VIKVTKRKRIWIAIVVAAVVVEGWAVYVLRPSAGRWRYESVVKDEPAAHALYDQMVATMRSATTLSYTCASSSPGERTESYRIWLKKPNYFRVEAISAGGALTGTLVGGGERLWVYWPDVCPLIDTEDTNIPREDWAKFYETHPTPVGRHSIGHEVRDLGRGKHMPFIDPSTFHGYTDSLQPYLDGVASRGTDKVGHEMCDVIEVSFMNAQRSWYLWLSQRDHLPRRAKEIIRGWWGTGIGVEEWLNVTLDAEIPQDKFAWSPPEGWRVWVPIDPATKLLKPGTIAPDFTLRSLDKGKIRLADFRDKIVWLYVWKAG